MSLEEVYLKWQNDPAFKEEFKNNPKKALEKAQLELSPEEQEKILKLFKFSDEELEKRINK